MAHVREVPRQGGIAYEARWKGTNGKFRQRTFTVKREAERFALKVENELADGQSTDALVKNAKKFQEVAQPSLDASTRLKPKTRRGYEDAYKLHIYPAFGDRRINTITSLDVEAWMADLENKTSEHTGQPLSASTRRGIVIALSKAFRYALKHRLISANPCAVIDKPTVVREEPVFLTPGQMGGILTVLEEREPVYALVARFAAYTGLRPGELEALRIRDINHLLRMSRFADRRSTSRARARATPRPSRPSPSATCPCRPAFSWRSASTSPSTRTAATPTRSCGQGGARVALPASARR
ncbi:tyrosine-type recombinase/integrase [Microbacterium sp. B2969]|uniref:Tyrosine-type recombinase/integrase n=1 Tax=Microbacterium alkaliflavum TaxID=3248839 RepID=A0ABW7Q2B0_9MICO